MSRARPGLLLFLVVAAVYAGSLRNGFHLDDFHTVVNNPHIRVLSNIPSFLGDAGSFSVNPESAMYRPLLLTTFAVDHALFGNVAAGYHATSVFFHGLAAAVALAWLVGLGIRQPVALTAALVFALHPINSEAVCYISSRSEVLMGLLLMGAAALHAKYRATTSRSWWLASLAAAAASLLSKSVGIIAPLAVAVGDGFTGGWQRVRSGWRQYLALLALGLCYIMFVRGPATQALLTAPVRSMAAQLFTQAKAHVYYLQLLALPVRLNVEHQFQVSPAVDVSVVFAVMLLGSVVAVAWTLRYQLRWLALAVGWWGLLLLPTTLIPLIVLVNEHRLYLASFGVILPVAVCLHSCGSRRRIGSVPMATWGLALYIAVLALLTMARTSDWQSEATLWADAAQKSPQMVRPHLRLADALASKGEMVAAEASYLRAIALRPRHPASRNNLGLFYSSLGRMEEAETQFRELLSASPDNVPARLNLAELELMRGRWSAADAHYDTALMYDDTGGRAQVRKGQIALRFSGNARGALDYFDAAIAAGAGDDADVHIGRGVALRSLGLDEQALAAYLQATATTPDRSDAWYNIGNLYLSLGMKAAALAAFQRVVDIGDDAALVGSARTRVGDLKSSKITDSAH
ncbi:MAG: tetratricopeptide repeat protein [bacterium]|nr:tetratricopeptide repeat protein [bacterium]